MELQAVNDPTADALIDTIEALMDFVEHETFESFNLYSETD